MQEVKLVIDGQEIKVEGPEAKALAQKVLEDQLRGFGEALRVEIVSAVEEKLKGITPQNWPFPGKQLTVNIRDVGNEIAVTTEVTSVVTDKKTSGLGWEISRPDVGVVRGRTLKDCLELLGMSTSVKATSTDVMLAGFSVTRVEKPNERAVWVKRPEKS